MLVTGVSGCGDDPVPRVSAPTATPPPSRLTVAERRELRELEGRISTHCVRVARSLTDPANGPTRAQVDRAFAAADAFVALAREKPTAPLDVGLDVRLHLSDVVENLEGANCDPRMTGYLERGLSSIPVE